MGHEFGAVTGRKRRCGWFDAVSLRRSIIHSSVSGLCLTKLDVLDGLDCAADLRGIHELGQSTVSREPPLFADAFADVEPVYEEMPGWKESTIGVTSYDASAEERARATSSACRQLAGVPIDIISTGPDRDQTIVLRHPFD